nr:putative mfs-type transporter [Quercus suber]
MGSLMIGPIISGSMSLHVGWRNFWWFNTALVGVSTLMVIFMFPETKWHRLHAEEVEKSHRSNHRLPDSNERGHDKDKHGSAIVQSDTNNTLDDAVSVAQDPHLGKGKPSKTQWRLYQPNANPFRSILVDIWLPWKMLLFPIVEFSAFVVSWSCSCFLTINLTQSQNFANPPYNFDSEKIGFMNFAVLIGALIGLSTGGLFSDWVSAGATRRNRGIREPEMRLPAMMPYVLIMILGNFIVAFGYQQKWHWAPIVVVGYACAGIQVSALPAIGNA